LVPDSSHFPQLRLARIRLCEHTLAGRKASVDADDARALMKPAHANAHKGTHGTLAIIGGANGMLGAVLLASRAGMRMGAGKVKIGWLAEPFPQVDPQMPEVMMRSAAEITTDESITALVVGCGMSVSGEAVRVLKAQLKRDLPIVLDADALNLIAESAELAKLVQSREKRNAPTIITPHPAEAARLLGASTSSVQSDRIRAARDLAKGYRCIAVLKGAGTVISDGENVSINRTGNPLLATAGTGDVLAGMIGAQLAQGHEAFSAARIGVALHGAAADTLKLRGLNRAIASDIVHEIAVL
jgi:ADP-dependent NAD(P)H-hydrate dehydratase / NAD(P)H-hydrate epimerase